MEKMIVEKEGVRTFHHEGIAKRCQYSLEEDLECAFVLG